MRLQGTFGGLADGWASVFTPDPVQVPRCECDCGPLMLEVERQVRLAARGFGNGFWLGKDGYANSTQALTYRVPTYRKRTTTYYQPTPGTGTGTFSAVVETLDLVTGMVTTTGAGIGELYSITYSDEITEEMVLTAVAAACAAAPWDAWDARAYRSIGASYGNSVEALKDDTEAQTRTSHEDINTGWLFDVSRVEVRYRFRVNFERPWMASSGDRLRITWRTVTRNYTGTYAQTTYYAPGSGSVGDPIIDESASITFSEELIELIDVPAGANSVTGVVHTLMAPTMGEEVSLTGPARASDFLTPGTAQAVLRSRRQKTGLDPYTATGQPTDPQPLYRCETASGVAPDGTAYTGLQSVTFDPTSGYPTYEDTFSDHISSAQTAPMEGTPDLGQETEVNPRYSARPDSFPSGGGVVSLTDTTVTYADGLTLTLSEEDPTARIVGLVTADIASTDVHDYRGVDSPSTWLAVRWLPPSERWYCAGKGAFQVTAPGETFGSIASRFLSPSDPGYWLADPPEVSLVMAWDEVTLDPDTGTRGVAGRTWIWSCVRASEAPSSVSPIYEYPVPTANQSLSVTNVRVASDDVPALDIGPQVEVI